MHTDLLAFVVALLAVAVLLGLRDTPCHDPQCAAFHKRHMAQEKATALEATQKAEHARYHSRDYPQAGCDWCTGGGWQS